MSLFRSIIDKVKSMARKTKPVPVVPLPPEAEPTPPAPTSGQLPKGIRTDLDALWAASTAELIAELGRRCPAMLIVAMDIDDSGRESWSSGVKGSWHTLTAINEACTDALRREVRRQQALGAGL